MVVKGRNLNGPWVGRSPSQQTREVKAPGNNQEEKHPPRQGRAKGNRSSSQVRGPGCPEPEGGPWPDDQINAVGSP